jgi:hypothetical protein
MTEYCVIALAAFIAGGTPKVSVAGLIIVLVVAWILFSTLLVTIICINSSRLSRLDEPFKDPNEVAKFRETWKQRQEQ